jgi:hypothetical protein
MFTAPVAADNHLPFGDRRPVIPGGLVSHDRFSLSLRHCYAGLLREE